MQSVRYEYSSVHLNLPKDLGDEIIDWGNKNIAGDCVFKDPNDASFGRENEMHITILYGLHSEEPQQTRKLFKKEPPIQVTLGKMELFTGPALFDVIIISVFSKDLKRLNTKLRDNVLFSNCYKIYVPHVTIAYVQKDKCLMHKGCNVFEGRKFSTDHVVFSSKNGAKEPIKVS